jgi:hypothetical protein
VSATEPVTSVLPVAFDPEPEPDEVPPVEGEPDEVDPDVDPGLLVIGPDWMDVGALVASGPEVVVL